MMNACIHLFLRLHPGDSLDWEPVRLVCCKVHRSPVSSACQRPRIALLVSCFEFGEGKSQAGLWSGPQRSDIPAADLPADVAHKQAA